MKIITVILLTTISVQITVCTSLIANKLDKLIKLSEPEALNIIDEKFILEKKI